MILHSKYTTIDLKIRTADNRKNLFESTKQFIRNGFDEAHTELEAESWIALAKEKGLHDLAEEMAGDLQFELER